MAKKVVISDESVNCYGCVVLTKGIDLTSFTANPVLLFNHSINQPVGTIDGLEKSDGKLYANDPKFSESDDFCKSLNLKYQENVVRGFSASLDINEVDFSYPGHEGMPVISKSTLNEISITPLPGNKNALRLMHNGQELTEQNKEILLSQYSQTKFSTMNRLLLSLVAAMKLTNSECKLTEKSTEEELEGAFKDVLNENIRLAAENKKLNDAVTAGKEAQCISLVDGAIANNKIKAVDRDTYLKLSRVDYESTKAALDNLKPHVSFSSQMNNSGQEQAQVDEKHKGWTWDDYHKKDSKALQLMKTQNPDQYKSLFKDKYGKEPVL